MSDVTQILERVEKGEGGRLLRNWFMEELRKLAAYKMTQERLGQTMQPTALVHEAWLKVVGQQQQRWENTAKFFIAPSKAMRRILYEGNSGRHCGTRLPWLGFNDHQRSLSSSR